MAEYFWSVPERAHLLQTAFSRSIQTLEADLGIRLFDRDTRSVMLTSAGHQLIARARELLGCAGRLAAEANDIAGAEGGELSFGVSMMAATVIPDVLGALRKSAPKLVANVEVNDWTHLLQRLELEHIEFVVTALRIDRDADPRFVVRHLPPQPASICCWKIDPPRRLKFDPGGLRIFTSAAGTRSDRTRHNAWANYAGSGFFSTTC